MANCLELTIFSGHREAASTIGKATYRIRNGPIFAGKIAVKSCTIYNTNPNVGVNSNILIFQQTGPNTSLGRIEITIPQGDYSGEELANVLQTAMNVALIQPDANVNISYDAITRKMQFVFDSIFDYTYETDDTRYFINSPGFQFPWRYQPSFDTSPRIILTELIAGNYRLDEWLVYVGDVMTRDAQVYEAIANIRLSNVSGDLKVTFETIAGSFMTLPGTDQSPQNVYLGIDTVGFDLKESYKSLVAFPYSSSSAQPNPMESVLNFAIGGIIEPSRWVTGALNLSGDLYLHFRSRILANRGHRTIENSRDTTFFSLPIQASFTQLQYHEPNERVWIDYKGGIELTGMDIELFIEFDQRVEPTANYVLELLIKQTQVF